MGFLDKLWDDTLAGPAPDSGLGKLRKYNSFSGSHSSSCSSAAAASAADPRGDDGMIPVTRSITILRRSNLGTPRSVDVNAFSCDSGSVPSSPAASATPTSPLSPGAPGHGGYFKKLTRRKPNPAAFHDHHGEPKSPASNDYDWIVLSALDRA